MTELKRKIFKFGMYGKPISLLSKTEINDLKECKWAEFYHKDDLMEIEKNIEFVPIRELDFEKEYTKIYVRMLFSYFKTFISNARFKEISSFKIFNYLLTNNDYVKQADLQHVGHVNTKKVSYVLKILRKWDLIKQKIIKNMSYVKLNIEELYKTNGKQNLPPLIPTNYCREVPIYSGIKKKLLNNGIGMMSEDIKKEYGLSVKRAHMYLKKIEAENSGDIGVKMVFDGRSRKHLFYRLEGNSVEDAIKEKCLITVDDRIRALNQLLSDKKWIATSEKTNLRFKELLGSKHVPDRKTLIATAIKANYKVFNIKGTHSTSSFIIAREGVNLADIINKKAKAVPKDNEYSKLVLSKYVKASFFISLDNLYESKLSKRADIICELVFDKFKHSNFSLQDDFLVRQPISFLLRILPLYRVDFLNKLKDALLAIKKDNDDSASDSTNILDFFSIKDVCELTSNYVKKEINERLKFKRLLRAFLEPIWLDCVELYVNPEILKKLNENFSGLDNCDSPITIDDKSFVLYKPSNKQNLNLLILECENVDLSIRLKEGFKEQINRRKTLEKTVCYVPYEDRIKLYQSALNVSNKTEFNNLVTRYIQANKYVARPDLIRFFRTNLDCTIDETKFINENSKEYLFTKIKHDIYIKNKIVPIEYNDYNRASIQEVLNDLNKTKYIKSSYRDFTLENIQPREEIKRRLDRKISLSIPNLDTYQERDTVYNMYFNVIFDVLIFSGTLEMEDLLNKCNVLEEFELLNFITVYEDVFEIEEVEDIKLISIKLNIDPFEISTLDFTLDTEI